MKAPKMLFPLPLELTSSTRREGPTSKFKQEEGQTDSKKKIALATSVMPPRKHALSWEKKYVIIISPLRSTRT